MLRLHTAVCPLRIELSFPRKGLDSQFDVIAFCLVVMKSQEGNIVGSVGTFYLIGTAWLAGRRGERTHLIDWSGVFIGLAGAVAAIALGVYTLHNSGDVDKTTAPAGMSSSSAPSYCWPLLGTSECSHVAEFQAGNASLGTCGECATDSSLRQSHSSEISSKFFPPFCAAPYS